MRLNLGEIAMSLGCNPGMVIWDGLGAGSARGRVVEDAPSSLRALVRQRTLGVGTSGGEYDPAQGFDCFEHAPWAGLFCTGAQIDSRKMQPGNLFFCLPGEHADGHDFAFDAARAGAIAIVASRNPWNGKAGDEANLILPPVFLVNDVRRALARVAKCHRESCLARVIGITGTAGKTSVKEVLAQVLEMRGRTERNPLNLNNQFGLPVSMLGASADASFWVMEMGISEDGDMDELGEILRPDVGIILNVGDGHVSGLGELGVPVHKARLLDYIQPGGTAVISADYADLNRQIDERLSALSRRGVQVLRFSHVSNNDASVRAAYVGADAERGIYRVWTKDFHFEVNTPFRGDFGGENVAAIVTVAIKLGLSQEAISDGFASAKLPEQRFNAERHPRCTLLDDSYNANPLSSARMLQAARSMADEYGQSLALVMGEMLELGSKAESAHEVLGENMAAVKPEVVFWKGGQTDAVARGLRKGGYSGKLYPLSGAQEFDALLEECNLDNVLVLFKGSRGNKLEHLVAVFREKVSPAGEN
jgi:UDP-N-acetylmuramoyl-tripeptide--D-alanyl-D-alanine ligase